MPALSALATRARQVMPGGNTRSTLFVPPAPPYASLGQGAYVWDTDGHKALDLQGNFTSLVHGHRHPVIMAAALEAMQTLTAVGLPTESEVAFAEMLTRRYQAAESVRITNSGTESVMLAVRAARAFTGRDVILRFEHCYHGFSEPVLPQGAPGLPDGVKGDFVTVPHGDTEALAAALDQHGEQLACVVVDLVPNRAGLRPAPREFARVLREGAAATGALLIVDEVIAVRLARGGFHSTYGLEPDLVAFGKLIGGGFPVGALGGRGDVMERFDPAAEDPILHGSTYNANPISMAAGMASLELLDVDAIDDINQMGDSLRERLTALGLAPTGYGSLLKVDAGTAQTELWWSLYEHGVLIASNGLMALSTVMTASDIDEIVSAFQKSQHVVTVGQR